jgi:cullin-associated NEDD8-dissociated protein 1
VFDQLLEGSIRPGLASGNVEEQRTIVQLIAAVARHSPHKIDSVLGVVAPGILEAAAKEDDELREYALQVGSAVISAERH